MNAADPKTSGITAALRHMRRNVGVVLALFALAGTALAATGGAGAGKFAAEFEALAVGDPSIEACRDLGEGGQKFEARYDGTFTVPAEFMPAEFRPAEFVPAEFRLALHLSLEVLYDRSTGVGTADGTWRLSDPPSESDPPTEFVASGELIAVVNSADSDLALDGMLIGIAESSAGDTKPLRVLFNFSATLSDGATFPHLKGATFPHLKGTVGDPSVGDPSVGDPTVGDPTVADPTVGDPSVGDPTAPASAPAVLVPAVTC